MECITPASSQVPAFLMKTAPPESPFAPWHSSTVPLRLKSVVNESVTQDPVSRSGSIESTTLVPQRVARLACQ